MPDERFNEIKNIVDTHNRWRREECINMIASENMMSPIATEFYTSDFESRYNEHDIHTHYQGVKFSMQIENKCNEIFGKRFNTKFVDSRPIAGSVANLCVYKAFLNIGDKFISPGLTFGGHVSSTRYGIAGCLGLKDIPMFFDAEKMRCDLEKTVDLIKRENPKLIMLGRSMFLFPEPIRELRESIGSEIKIIYDAAHVFGLIYGHQFQQPLEEGADIITSSTHKTFPGPQGGIIIGKPDLDENDWRKIQNAIFPGVLSNHHIHALPALAVTALEMNEFGDEYASQVVRNAQHFGKVMDELGFKPLCQQYGYTKSHQVIVDVKDLGGGKPVAEKMEEANIIINKIALPTDSDADATKNPSGVRIGLQELTRVGMKEKEIEQVAEFYRRVLLDKENPETVKKDVIEFKKDFIKPIYHF